MVLPDESLYRRSSRCRVRSILFRSMLSAMLFLVSWRPEYASADFVVPDWALGIYVDLEPGGSDGRGFFTVTNPFVDQHSVQLGLSSAAAQYDISWLINYGSFNIAAQLAAQDGSSVHSLASGTIWLQSDTDLTLSLDSLMNYNLPGPGLDSYLSFSVRDLTINQYVFGDGEGYSTDTDPPGSGTLGITANIALTGAHQFRIQYGMELYTFGASSALATADGYVNWDLAPAPEPATLALVLLSVPALCRRR